MLPSSICFNTLNSHRLLSVPRQLLLAWWLLLVLTSQQFCVGYSLMVLQATPCLRQCPSPECPQLAFRFVIWDRPLQSLAVNDADFISALLFGFASGSIGFSFGSGAADSVSGTATVVPVISLLPLLSSPYLFGQCLVNHLISSIQPFCSMRSGSEAFFDSLSAAI